MTDYKELLDNRGFEISGENCKLHPKGHPDEFFPPMSEKEYDELCNIV